MLIGLTGYARAGKDSVANVLVEQFGFVKVGFADALREMALDIDPLVAVESGQYLPERTSGPVHYSDAVKLLGYEGAKALPEVRRFLQRLGTEGIRKHVGEDAWVNILNERIERLRKQRHRNFAIIDVRFPNEARYALMEGLLWRVNRPGYGPANAHASESHIASFTPDAELTATNLTELREATIAAYRLVEDTL